MNDISSKNIIEEYVQEKDWRVKENSNAIKSFGALGKYIIGEVTKSYWLREVYNPANPEIAEAHRRGFFHIHDLGALTVYCCGYSLRELLKKGVKGVPNIPQSKPAQHFDAALNQLSNLISVWQNEIAGAVATSSVDVLLSPYIKKDRLSYREVKQSLQNFIFSINSNSRAGAEPAFSNVTLDLTPDRTMVDEEVVIAGVPQGYTYKDCQAEIDMFNKAFCEIMIEGDSNGKPFAYPIPTYNISERFDWDNPNNDLLWEMSGKYGYPYFANFINSDMDPEESRSMCCRLRLDMRELSKKYGGYFGSGDSTGSIGVVTINLPRLAYLASTDVDSEELPFLDQVDKEARFYKYLRHYMTLAKDSLVIKRKYLQENILDAHLIPAFEEYVGTLRNHFNTIGYLGMNEMCLNLFGKNIKDKYAHKFCLDVLDFMRSTLSDFQEETGELFNLEATPAESTCYRLALLDQKEFGSSILQQGTPDAPYYTNSCHMAVRDVTTIKDLFDHQDDLQAKHTGGTVVHLYLDGPINGKQAKYLVKKILHEYKVPYISLSPLTSVCPEHGWLNKPSDRCPICNSVVIKMQRITGYIRPVNNQYGTILWNKGKESEFKDRHMLNRYE